MFQIRRETDYAIRCVLYLSNKPGEVIMVDEIAGEMAIPKSFLAKILQRLSKAGIITSHVGVNGGSQLAKEPERITLYDVIEAIEGPVAMNRCTVSEKACEFSRTCLVHPVWITIRAEVEKLLKSSNFKNMKLSGVSVIGHTCDPSGLR